MTSPFQDPLLIKDNECIGACTWYIILIFLGVVMPGPNHNPHFTYDVH